MIKWSILFETKLKIVDIQHQKLFQMLNAMMNEVNVGLLSEKMLDNDLNGLMDFAKQHFSDEEDLMASHNLDMRFIDRHHMEHNSFFYDVKRMRNHPNIDDELSEKFSKLIRFTTSWLVYHTLRTDQLMAVQIHAIEQGSTPAKAYELSECTKLNPALNTLIFEALLHLWSVTTQQCRDLEIMLAVERARSNDSCITHNDYKILSCAS